MNFLLLILHFLEAWSSKLHQVSISILMEGYHLLGSKDEPSIGDQETDSTLCDSSRTFRPALNLRTVLGSILLLSAIGGNIFQYWQSRYETTHRYRSKIGEFRPFFQNIRLLPT